MKNIVIDVKSGQHSDPGFPINWIGHNALQRTTGTSFVVIGSTAKAPPALYHVDIMGSAAISCLKLSVKIKFPDTYFATAQSITFPRVHGPGGGNAYGIFWSPSNPEYEAPANTLPPLIVVMHGGPTFQEGPRVFMRDQFWTTRGYALVQLNYVGSTGYGKDYVSLLDRQWGISDIADAVSCVEYLAKEGFVDPKRIGITGHSAGGYATMQAMAVYHDIWRAGIAESGISNMQAMIEETHKFESQYLFPLCFETGTSPEDQQRIIGERSPINSAQQIKAPMLIFSGADDNVVPPNQAYMLAEKIKEGGKADVEVKVYTGEGHIFSQGSTLKDMEVRREQWFRRYLVGE